MSEAQPAPIAGLACSASDTGDSQAATLMRHIAHELRQPLSTIESIAYYLDMVLPTAEERARQQLDKLQHQVHQINWTLVDAIHLLHPSPCQPQWLNLSAVVAEGLETWRSATGQEVRSNLADALPLHPLDPAQVEGLLRGLLQLFHRAADPEGEVTVSTYATVQELILEVSSAAGEEGIEELKRATETGDSRLSASTGLGLAAMRHMVDAHGAHIGIDTLPGTGVSLKVVFPLAA